MWGVEITVMLCMIGLNGLFAAYEIALASVGLARLQVLVEQRRIGAHAALAMKQGMEASLAVVQLAITMVGAISAATGGAGASEELAPRLRDLFNLTPAVAEFVAVGCVVLPLTFVTIVVGELIPKVFALRNAEWVCLTLSPGMKWFSRAVWPIVWLLESTVTLLMRWGELAWKRSTTNLNPPAGDAHGRSESAELQELRASAAIARTSRLIGPREEKIILGASILSHRPIREVMLPAESISMLDVQSNLMDALVVAHRDLHTRFPVTEQGGDPQAIIGYVTFKDLVSHLRIAPREPTLQPIVRTLLSFQADEPVSRCMERLIRDRSHIALVREADGKVAGLVTMEDIIEELVGEIEDEYDRLPAHLVQTGRGWIAGGGVSLNALRQSGIDLQSDLPPAGARTLAEWISGHVGEPIQGGEFLERGPVRLTVRKSRRHKVLEAYFEKRA